MRSRLLIYLLPVLLTSGLVQAAGGDAESAHGSPSTTANATVLWYEVEEPGTAAYPVRITVTDNYLRIDDDDPDSGYILFDRAGHEVYSVNHDEHSILEFPATRTALRFPATFRHEELVVHDEQLPAVGGKRPLHVQLQAGGSTCYEVMAVPGLLEPAAAALDEYAQVMAARQLENLGSVPADIRTPCYLLRYVYGASLPYREGMPIREWDSKGYSRILVDYREKMPVNIDMFALPEGYQRYQMGNLRGRGDQLPGSK
jgi:hypothetical protein